MDDLSGVRVLEVDQSAAWRSFVVTQLQERSVRVVGTAADGLEAVHKARILHPDLIIMDTGMPGLDGLEATREICIYSPESKILIVSNDDDPAVIQAAFDAGARGYVLKWLAAVELLPAVEAIVDGAVFIGRGLSRDGRP